jgi:hypothetical protein
MNGERIDLNSVAAIPLWRQQKRFDELDNRWLLAAAKAKLEAEGRNHPDLHFDEMDPSRYQPLTASEHLERVALGTSIAQNYARPALVHHAVIAGANWQEIADATGNYRDLDAPRRNYRAWAEQQHDLHQDMGVGLDDTAYAAALARSEKSLADLAAEAEGLPSRTDLDTATAATAAAIHDRDAMELGPDFCEESGRAMLLDVLRAAEAEEAVFEAYARRPGAEAELQAGI